MRGKAGSQTGRRPDLSRIGVGVRVRVGVEARKGKYLFTVFSHSA